MAMWTSIKQIHAAMDSGKIRTIAEQNKGLATGVVCTHAEQEARLAYINHILAYETPKRLP